MSAAEFAPRSRNAGRGRRPAQLAGLLEGFLRSEGYAVRRAEDGATALRLAQERPPDVVLLDVMMPGMSGLGRVPRPESGPGDAPVPGDARDGARRNGPPGRRAGHRSGRYVRSPCAREEFLARVRSAPARAPPARGSRAGEAALRPRNEELELKKTLAPDARPRPEDPPPRGGRKPGPARVRGDNGRSRSWALKRGPRDVRMILDSSTSRGSRRVGCP